MKKGKEKREKEKQNNACYVAVDDTQAPRTTSHITHHTYFIHHTSRHNHTSNQWKHGKENPKQLHQGSALIPLMVVVAYSYTKDSHKTSNYTILIICTKGCHKKSKTLKITHTQDRMLLKYLLRGHTRVNNRDMKTLRESTLPGHESSPKVEEFRLGESRDDFFQHKAAMLVDGHAVFSPFGFPQGRLGNRC